MSRVAWISHAECLEHEMGYGHPECPARLRAIEAHLSAVGIAPRLLRLEAPRATRADLLRVHTRGLVEAILDAPVTGYRRVDPDTTMNEHTAEAALRAAGAALLAVDTVRAGKADLAFCAVRPPGHHAGRDKAMGFCFFNNLAVGVAHALAEGVRRVAVLDFDVHFGNGTAEIFRDDPRVLVCNTYEWPFYPFAQSDPHNRHLLDVPLPAGADGEEFRIAVEHCWWPAVEAHAPGMLFVSAGFDAHVADPLAGLRFGAPDYAWIGSQIKRMAERHCGGRVVATLEGGYDLNALGQSVAAFLQAFLDD